MCIHRVREEITKRPRERFAWTKFACAPADAPAPELKLKPGFLLLTRDVASLLVRLRKPGLSLDVDALLPLLDTRSTWE